MCDEIQCAWSVNAVKSRLMMTRSNVGGESIRFESALSAGSHHADWFAAMLPDVIESFHRPEAALESFDEAALCLSVIRRAYQMA